MNRRGAILITLCVMMVVFSTAFKSQDVAKADTNKDELATITQQVNELKSSNDEVSASNVVLKTSNQELETLIVEFESELETTKKQLETAKERQTVAQAKIRNVNVPSTTSNGDWTNFTATFYNAGTTSTGKKPGDKQYGMTRSGNPVTPGVTVSVDPKVIPLGSWVEIQFPDGHTEKRRADDTGGAIKGHIIDVFMPLTNSELLDLGRVKVQVRLLKPSN